MTGVINDIHIYYYSTKRKIAVTNKPNRKLKYKSRIWDPEKLTKISCFVHKNGIIVTAIIKCMTKDYLPLM